MKNHVGIFSFILFHEVYDSADVAVITKPEVLSSLNLYVFYQWSQWSECNRCSGKGVKKRIGTCMLKV